MSMEQLVAGLVRADLFMVVAVGLLSIVVFAFQIFAAAVGVRFLVFVWHWLGYQEVSLHEKALKLNGSWTEEQRPQLQHLQVSEGARWKAILTAMFVLVVGTIIVAGFFVFNQPAGWLVLLVVVAVLLILLAVVMLN